MEGLPLRLGCRQANVDGFEGRTLSTRCTLRSVAQVIEIFQAENESTVSGDEKVCKESRKRNCVSDFSD